MLQQQLSSPEPIYYVVERDDDYISVSNAQMYFSDVNEWPRIESDFLKYVQSPVLDVGCGAGRHSLYLQKRGYNVTSMDVSPSIVSVCKQRGLENTILGSVHDLPEFQNPFRSILLLGANISLGGTYKGMEKMFADFHRITTDDAIIIGNYRSLETDDPVHLQYHHNNKEKGNPPGQIKIRVRYEKQKSDWFCWFIPSVDEFDQILDNTGWKIRKHDLFQSINYVVLEKQD